MHLFRIKFLLSLRNIGLSILTTILTLCALEIGLRGYNAYISFQYPGESASASVYMYDPVLGWKLRPNATAYYSQQLDMIRTKISVNSHGLRGKEHSYEKKDTTIRICLIGNSAIAGFEVDESQLVSTKLEQMLNHGFPAAGALQPAKATYEVINFGVRGYGTDQSYLSLKSKVCRYKPDIVIYVFSGNDFNDNITVRNPNRTYAKSYFLLNDSGKPVLKGIPVPVHFSDTTRYITVFNAADTSKETAGSVDLPMQGKTQTALGLYKSIKNDFSHSALYCLARKAVWENPWLLRSLAWTHAVDHEFKGAPNLANDVEQKALAVEGTNAYKTRLLGGLLCAMHVSTDSMGAKFFVYEMSNGSGEKPTMPTMVNRLCDSCGIPYINSIPLFFEKANGSKHYSFEHDGHWNAKGHALAAKIMYDYLCSGPRELGNRPIIPPQTK